MTRLAVVLISELLEHDQMPFDSKCFLPYQRRMLVCVYVHCLLIDTETNFFRFTGSQETSVSTSSKVDTSSKMDNSTNLANMQYIKIQGVKAQQANE